MRLAAVHPLLPVAKCISSDRPVQMSKRPAGELEGQGINGSKVPKLEGGAAANGVVQVRAKPACCVTQLKTLLKAYEGRQGDVV